MVSFSDKTENSECLQSIHVTNSHAVFGLALFKNEGCSCQSISRLHGQVCVPAVDCDLLQTEHRYT